MLEQIQQNLHKFSKSEKKVAQIILQSPNSVIHLNIATLALQAEVSEPTVNRFCRRLGTRGYPDFKLQLAQKLASNSSYINAVVTQKDSTASYCHKILDSSILCLEQLKANLNPIQIEQGVMLMLRARQLGFLGLGASAVVAMDAQNKFLHFDIPVMCNADPVMQQIYWSRCHRDDLLILISHTGRTLQLIDIAKLAQENGAKVLSICQKNSPLVAYSDHLIEVNVDENTDVYFPMQSRLAHLIVIDLLATGFALKKSPELSDQLKKIKTSLQRSRYPQEQR